ncbi:MAG: glutamyl-tRNA reductase [Gammaproteobacteria bacterium]|nr:glutamyl-tRNA reductase [Gammaproteobacteria bacterium]MDE2345283.1 glutamyl-tRNA reductase [Gammaproteobacteria bacterium]
MSFFILGISHATAPVDIRERMSFSPEQIPVALSELRGLEGVREAAILSTCNRTEIYTYLENENHRQITDWLTRLRSPDDPGVSSRFYSYEGLNAARHLFRVACGLDSMILGEPQILGQIKDAYQQAQQSKTTGHFLHRLFQFAFAVAKHVRTDTRIGEHPVSVAYASVHLARQIFADFSKLTALLIGAGETMELVAQHLREQGTQRMIIANRTLSRGHELAERFGAYAIGLHEIPTHLGEADIVISATGSPNLLLTHATVSEVLKARKRRPVLMMDIAVPRDIDPKVMELSDVYLFTIDDLHSVVENNQNSRRVAAKQAELLIDSQVTSFIEQLRGLDAVPAIRAVRNRASALKEQTLQQAQQMLHAGTPPDQVLNFLAETLTNRLMHAPTAYLRQAANEGRDHIIRQAHELFGLMDKPPDKQK